MLGIEDIEKMKKDYKTMKFNKEEIRLLSIAVANEILRNRQSIEIYKETDEIAYRDLETRNKDYLELLQILQYFER